MWLSKCRLLEKKPFVWKWKAGSEQCDNGNKIGCQTGCVPDLGFTCTGAIGAASTCAVTCGDGVKGGDE